MTATSTITFNLTEIGTAQPQLVQPFEIGSHTGYISRENKESLAKLHKFCKTDIKLKQFRKNISAIAVLGSYYIFNNRNIESWHKPSEYMQPPMNNM